VRLRIGVYLYEKIVLCNVFWQNMFSNLAYVLSSKKGVAGLEDLLFYTITQGKEKLSVARFLTVSCSRVTVLSTLCVCV